MSLFQSLTHFQGQLESLRLNVRFLEDGRLNVIVAPEVNEETRKKAPELANEFQLIGTAAELDAGLAGELSKLATTRASLAEQASRQIDVVKAAATKVAAKPGKPATTTSKASSSTTPAVSGTAAGDVGQAGSDALDLFSKLGDADE